MRQTRRGLLAAGAAALAGMAGCTDAVATGSNASNDGGDGDGGAASPEISAVSFVRNVEEVRGHLASSATLLEQARREDAALHAGHGPDYFAPVLTPVRDADPELATRLRGRLSSLEEAVRSMTPTEYRDHVEGDVLPLLDQAVEAVVPEDVRWSMAFDVRVMNALAGRIAEEYTAAVPEAGTIELAGEYWDGRGFLTGSRAASKRSDRRSVPAKTRWRGCATGRRQSPRPRTSSRRPCRSVQPPRRRRRCLRPGSRADRRR